MLSAEFHACRKPRTLQENTPDSRSEAERRRKHRVSSPLFSFLPQRCPARLARLISSCSVSSDAADWDIECRRNARLGKCQAKVEVRCPPLHLPFDFHLPTSIFTPTASEYEPDSSLEGDGYRPRDDKFEPHTEQTVGAGEGS